MAHNEDVIAQNSQKNNRMGTTRYEIKSKAKINMYRGYIGIYEEYENLKMEKTMG